MSGQDYYDGPPHERHGGSPPNRPDYEPPEQWEGRPDFYSHEGRSDGERSFGGRHHEQQEGQEQHHDRGILGTLAGGAAGAFGGHALGGKSGHGGAGTIMGALAGAFAGHEVEEKAEDWEHKHEEEKKRRHEQESNRPYGYEGERHGERHGEHQGYGQGYGHEKPRGEFVQVTVQPGDTLRGIAERFDGVSFEEIARHNNIPNPDMIYPGQVLEVPTRPRW